MDSFDGTAAAWISAWSECPAPIQPLAMRAEDWAYCRGVQLDFTRPGKLVENAFIESFNGRLRDECLNVHQFTSLDDARRKIAAWRFGYNQRRPHGSLGHLTPNEFVRQRQEAWAIENAALSG